MLRLVSIDKERKEESKVEDMPSPLFFLQLVFFVSIFVNLEQNNLVFPETHRSHESVSVSARRMMKIFRATKSFIMGPHFANSENCLCFNVVTIRKDIFK